jgi:hypothetical protein
VGDGIAAVADEGEREALEGAEALAQRQEVGERLAGAVHVGARVDDRRGRRIGHNP